MGSEPKTWSARTQRPEGDRAGVDSGGASRQFRHGFSRLRSQARRSRRHRRGLRYLSAAHDVPLCGSPTAASSPRRAAPTSWRRRRAIRRWTRPTAPRVRWFAKPALRNIARSRSSRRKEQPPKELTLYPSLRLRQARLRLGHGDRYELLRGLQQLHHRLPVGKQHRRGRQGAGRHAAGTCTGCAWMPTTRATATIPRHTSSRFPACNARTRPAKSSVRWARPCTAARA